MKKYIRKKNEMLDLINREEKYSKKTKGKLSGRMLFSESLWKIYLSKDANIIIKTLSNDNERKTMITN